MDATRRTMPLLALLLVVGLVAGCGSHTPTTRATAHAPTATPTAAMPSPTAQPTVNPGALASCQSAPGSTATQAGDLLLSKPTEPFDYPAVRLPDSTPLKPLQVNVQVSGPLAGASLVNPGGLTGSMRTLMFVSSICNSSASATHTVQSVSARIDALTPFSGQLNVWPGCNRAFSQQNPNPVGGGCGGRAVVDEGVRATFAAGAQAGATVVATQDFFSPTQNNPSLTPLPFRMSPGAIVSLAVYVSVPNMAGTYAFSVGYQIDNAPAAFSPAADPDMAGPVAHAFTGAACNTSAMLAQIPPATTPETYYVCPA